MSDHRPKRAHAALLPHARADRAARPSSIARGRPEGLPRPALSRLLASIAALALGCGGAPGLSLTFPDNQPDELRAVLARADERAAPDPPVAVGLAERQLYAFDLEAGRLAWQQPVEDARTAPAIAGELVVLQEGERVVARRLTDGSVALALPAGNLGLVGAAGEGELAAIVLSTGGAVGARSRVFIVRGGGVASQLALEVAAGAPAVRGGLVFLPWGNQNVSAIDGETGAELARLRFLDGVVGHVRASPAGLVFGQGGAGRFAAEVSREAVGWYEPDVSALPGRAPLWRSAYEPPAGPESAAHKIALAWAPAAGEGPLRMTDDTVYLRFYRMVFGLAQDGLSPRFVYEHPADVVGAAACEGGVLLADAEGGLTFVGADGRARLRAETGMAPSVVALRIEGFTPPSEAGPAPPPLADQLLGAAQSTDARLVPARAFAVRQLAAQPEAGVTEHLIVLCDERALPADLRRAACEALGGRELGGDAVLAALGRRASYLAGTRPPPVGALATVAARMGEPRAVPLLIGHLRDPETPLADFPALAAALAQLADETAVEPLEDFLWLYHAEGEDPALAAALGHVARALVTLAGPVGRDEVQRVMDAPFTTAAVRAQLAAALQAAADDAEPAAPDTE